MPTEVAERANREPVHQLSVFADNKVGRLNDLISRFASRNIHIAALSQVDSTECSIMRLIVNYPDDARALLEEFNYTYSVTPVLAVELLSADALREVTCALVEAEINIHYLYAFLTRPLERTALAMHVEDMDLAAQVLISKGLKVLDQQDIAR
ncbi:MAG: putative acetolactate synthase small regulatory subunit [Puniceicoccaceae bacterium 5H]|nr:MAG: putative acetolactate synthase small regulatory subunit [Puniceicoccaceae bacterium 5H]